MIPDLNPELKAFAVSVHDWLAHLCGQASLWPDYDSHLSHAIRDHVATLPVMVNAPIGHGLDLPSLVRCHYQVRLALTHDIDSRPDYPWLYVTMASTLSDAPQFGPTGRWLPWGRVDQDPHPINSLRTIKPQLLDYHHQLMMRQDVTVWQLSRDQACLSSLALLYGLYLVKVILIFENTVRPTPALLALLTATSQTLSHLKGVFHYGENQWLCSDV